MDSSPQYTRREEKANYLSHGFGAIFGIAALVLMIIFTSRKGNSWHIVSMTIYGTTMVLVFISSTLVHSVKPGKFKEFFNILDQIAIYLLIAGTYTPLALVSLKNDWGWLLFGLEWGLALIGILAKSLLAHRYEKSVNYFTLFSYVLMGWMLLFFLLPIFRQVPLHAIILIFIGGGLYTFGTIFYKMEKLKYHHLIWHVFVLGGSAVHFIAIFRYLIPWD